jgi:3-oxoacyl-[acyl-carrier protein] reductase
MFQQAFDRFGHIDVLIVNAAIWPPEDCGIDEMTLERWQRVIDVNQTSTFLCTRSFFRSLKQTQPESASLILIGSTAAMFGEAQHVEYSASKAAMVYGMTRSLKNEITKIVPRGRVNAVCPGWTRTPMAEPGLADKAAYKRAMQTRAIPKISEPEDIAYITAFLASDKLANQITGEIITVAGGMEGRILWDAEDIPAS